MCLRDLTEEPPVSNQEIRGSRFSGMSVGLTSGMTAGPAGKMI
jgi:hypothetical protein